MTDTLDQLTDAELSEVFAVEVAGEKPERLAFASRDGGASGCLFEASRRGFTDYGVTRQAVEEHCRKYPEYKVIERDVYHTSFATSADAVLPFLAARLGYTAASARVDNQTHVHIWGSRPSDGTAPTFARAACIALIRSKRAEKGAAA